MEMSVLLALWSALFAAYLGVSITRWSVGHREDDHLHVLDSEKELVGVQMSVSRKLDMLDRWKAALLVATLLAGLAIAVLHMYAVWQRNAAIAY